MLKLLILSTFIINPVAEASKPISLDDIFLFAAAENNIPVSLLRGLCWVESNHRVKTPVKPDGSDLTPSLGVCQIKLRTARDRGFKGSMGELAKPMASAYYAAKHLRHLLDKYNSVEKALTVYNRGAKNIHRARLNNIYVLKVKMAMHEGR